MGALVERSLAHSLAEERFAEVLTELESLSEEEAREIVDREQTDTRKPLLSQQRR
jgi:hypothetical protein